jgi:hypothetical protein
MTQQNLKRKLTVARGCSFSMYKLGRNTLRLRSHITDNKAEVRLSQKIKKLNRNTGNDPDEMVVSSIRGRRCFSYLQFGQSETILVGSYD